MVDLRVGRRAPAVVDEPDGAVTAPFARSPFSESLEAAMTADLGGPYTADLGRAGPFGDAGGPPAAAPLPTDYVTAALGLKAGAGVNTMPLSSFPGSANSRDPEMLADDAFTAPLARPGAVLTAGLPGAEPQTADLGLDVLRAVVEADPSDVDTLFRLAVQLNRQGETVEARTWLTRLAAAYQNRGQPAQAARILQMLGLPTDSPTESPPSGMTTTGPFDTAAAGTMPLSAPPSVTARLRQTGRIALGDTLPLRGTGMVGAKPTEVEAPAMAAPFPTEALEFTVPLPGQDALDADVRATIEESAQNLADGKLDAALDACIFGLALDDSFLPLSMRIAEIYTAQRQTRRARSHAETLLRLMKVAGADELLWMGYRILLHTADRDLASLRSLVELLIDAGRVELASFYASRLIRLLDSEGLADQALDYSVRLCDLVPGDTRAALENAVLRLKSQDSGGALDRWETAVAAGADPITARASLAAVMTVVNVDDHWRMLGEVLPAVRAGDDAEVVDAYTRTAEVMATSPTLTAGRGLLLAAVGDLAAIDVLSAAAGDRAVPPMARASSALTLATILAETGNSPEHVAAVRTALQLLEDPAAANYPGWLGLLGMVPRFEDLSLQLGGTLLAANDAAGAVAVLKAAHDRTPHHNDICEALADAYFRSGQLGNALTVLDGLAGFHRAAGQLEPMAAVLRRMSQLAPNNIKVKSRLIDTYLQRGFVAEARGELILRAELEERSGLIKDAVGSLQRAADLAWTVGLADETFTLYRRILLLTPDMVDNRHAVVALYLQVGRLVEAAEHQRAIVDISLREDRKHEAIAALHQVIGLTPDDTSAYYQLGELLAGAGEYHQAERVYRRIMTITPDDDLALAKATSMASLAEQHAE